MSSQIACVTIQFGFVGMLAQNQGIVNIVNIHDWYESIELDDKIPYMTQINLVLNRLIQSARLKHDKTDGPSKGFGHVLVQTVVVINHTEN